MKKIFIFIPLIFFQLFSYITANNLTGKDIIKMVHNANLSKIGMVIKGRMDLIDLKTKKKKSRSYIILTKREKGLKRMLFRFTDSSYKGTTFLTIEKPNKKDLQYIYLKSVGSPRQVSSSDKENNFVDTDISNEDLGSGNINDYTYKRLPDKKIKNIDCYVVERYPKNKKSKYSKHIVFIDKEKLIILLVKFYSKEGRLIKTIKASNIHKIGKNIYMAFKMEITNILEKHKTVVNIIEAKEKSINRGYFNKNRMARNWVID